MEVTGGPQTSQPPPSYLVDQTFRRTRVGPKKRSSRIRVPKDASDWKRIPLQCGRWHGERGRGLATEPPNIMAHKCLHTRRWYSLCPIWSTIPGKSWGARFKDVTLEDKEDLPNRYLTHVLYTPEFLWTLSGRNPAASRRHGAARRPFELSAQAPEVVTKRPDASLGSRKEATGLSSR